MWLWLDFAAQAIIILFLLHLRKLAREAAVAEDTAHFTTGDYAVQLSNLDNGSTTCERLPLPTRLIATPLPAHSSLPWGSSLSRSIVSQTLTTLTARLG